MRKNLLVICGLFLLTLASCNEQSNITPTDTTSTVSSARDSADSTKNTTKVAVTQANLLTAISSYLTTNYAGYTFVSAYSKSVSSVITGYSVDITLNSTPYHIHFDAAGTFVSVNSTGRKGKVDQSIAAVTQADLLTTIKTYLNTNYAGYTFINAYSETSNSTLTGYDVNITYNSVNYHVTFDATGTFVSVGTRKVKTATTNVPVAQADLLAAISTYLNSNYAGYTFVNAYSEAVSGVISNYDVNITSNSVTYHVVFDATGVFISVGTKKAGKKK